MYASDFEAQLAQWDREDAYRRASERNIAARRRGASARVGDAVRNLTTGAVGVVTGSRQWGGLIVATTDYARERSAREGRAYGETWERWNVQTIARNSAQEG